MHDPEPVADWLGWPVNSETHLDGLWGALRRYSARHLRDQIEPANLSGQTFPEDRMADSKHGAPNRAAMGNTHSAPPIPPAKSKPAPAPTPAPSTSAPAASMSAAGATGTGETGDLGSSGAPAGTGDNLEIEKGSSGTGGTGSESSSTIDQSGAGSGQ